VSVSTSFLGAHALPPEAAGDKDAFIDLVCARNAACDGRGRAGRRRRRVLRRHRFSGTDGRVFDKARALGLPVKLHADQLVQPAWSHSRPVTARCRPIISSIRTKGAAAMAKAGTVAVMLPGAYLFHPRDQKPPIELFRMHGVPMARGDRLQSRHIAADLAAA
jgi:imidazolonepropionase